MMMAVGECLQEDPYTRMPVGQCLSPILVDHESNSSITKCISFVYTKTNGLYTNKWSAAKCNLSCFRAAAGPKPPISGPAAGPQGGSILDMFWAETLYLHVCKRLPFWVSNSGGQPAGRGGRADPRKSFSPCERVFFKPV